MSYSKQGWQTGDTITAQKINNMDNGIYNTDHDLYRFFTDEIDGHMSGGPFFYAMSGGDYYYIPIVDLCTYTCFRGDTTFITMYDGTKKLLKDIRPGDSILGYNVNTKSYCESIVIKNFYTGKSLNYNCYVMSDGTTVDIVGQEEFGTIRTSQTGGANYTEYYHLDDLLDMYNNNTLGDRKILKDTGNLEGGVQLIDKKEFSVSVPTEHFTLITSNNTYFANGLLHVEPVRTTIDELQKRYVPIPDGIKEIYDALMLEYAAEDEILPNDHIKNLEDVEDMQKLREAQAIITQKKEYLSATDYKAIKYAEGVLPEEEWLPVKALRAEAREIINEKELEVESYGALVIETNPEFYNNTSEYQHAWINRWRAAQAILDAHLEDFRNWGNEERARIEARIAELQNK